MWKILEKIIKRFLAQPRIITSAWDKDTHNLQCEADIISALIFCYNKQEVGCSYFYENIFVRSGFESRRATLSF